MPREVLARALALLADEDPAAFLALRDYFGGADVRRMTSRTPLPEYVKWALDRLAGRVLR
jgi:hypothetical protein